MLHVEWLNQCMFHALVHIALQPVLQGSLVNTHMMQTCSLFLRFAGLWYGAKALLSFAQTADTGPSEIKKNDSPLILSGGMACTMRV